MILGFLLQATLKDFVRPQRLMTWGVLAAVLYGLARLYVYVGQGEPAADSYGQLSLLLVYRVLMLAAAIYASAVIAAEVEQKTIVYLLTRPVSRSSLIWTRMLAAAIIVAAIAVTCALLVSHATYGASFLSNPYLLRDLKALLAGAAAYTALFTLVSLWVNRAMLVNLLFAFGWETATANMTGNIYKLSVFSYLKAVAEKPTSPNAGPLGILSGNRSVEDIPASTGTIVLILLILVCVWLCAWWFERFPYLPREDVE
jgi:ABC-2 type transport system permease protein